MHIVTFQQLFMRVSMCIPHGDMGVVTDHLLRQHLHMDVGVIELLPHLPQLTHGIVQIAFALAPAVHRGRKLCISLSNHTAV